LLQLDSGRGVRSSLCPVHGSAASASAESNVTDPTPRTDSQGTRLQRIVLSKRLRG
jgi:hypothetical protein